MVQALFIQEGESIDYTPSTAKAAGEVVVQNALVGICKTPIAANQLGSLAIEGLFDVAKATGAINPGAWIYWDADGNPVGGVAGTGAATTTSGGNTAMGIAVLGAASDDATVRVVLVNPVNVANTVITDLTNEITDPGDTGAIPVTASGHCDLVSAKAETRTLTAPASVGQQLLLSHKTDGGDCVVTCATAVNQTGNNTLTFGDAGDSILLVAVASGTNKRWRVVANDGVVLSTV